MIDKILVNDIIIINKDKRDNAYSMFDKWFKLYGISTNNYNKCLTEHIERDNIDEKYRCIWIAPHPTLGRMLYAIEGLDTKQVFLINTDAILGYYHTFNSRDNTNTVLMTLASKCYNLDLELKKIKSVINEQSVAATDNSNVMPELEDGMYGIIVDNLHEHKNYKFRVAHGCIFMDNGWVYGVDDFEDGFYNDLDIVEISTGVESFDQYRYGTVVWTVVYNES